MFNVLLDALPWEWNGHPIDMNFDTGIKVSQCLSDEELTPQERIGTALYLIFPNGAEKLTAEEITDVLSWYMNGWNNDNVPKKKDETIVMDFDIDQWRIYAAFRSQYNINLNRAHLHFWEYMALLSNLSECAFTQVINIRSKKLTSKMSAEEKKSVTEAKKVYAIHRKSTETPEEHREDEEALVIFNKMRNKV